MLFFNVRWNFLKSVISCSLVINCAYQHYILEVEAKNSAKMTFHIFNTTAVFLRDVMMSENDVIEAGSAVGVFSWVTLSSDCRFELEVECIRASRSAV